MPTVLATNENIEKASQILRSGGVVSFPTETVYGLGCDTQNKDSIALIYTLKNRPINNPLIAHVRGVEEAKTITKRWDHRCDKLANAFWPGPLTIILDRSGQVPSEASGGCKTIAIRAPKHEVAYKLLTTFGGPISAPSANLSGRTSPTTAKHVHDDFGDELFILDGGECDRGIESTVLSMVGPPTILRLGSIKSCEIENIIGEVVVHTPNTQNESPGSSMKHYAPKSKLVLETTEAIHNQCREDTVILIIKAAPVKGTTIQMSSDPKEYAKYLYAAIREADAKQPKIIYVESPPKTPEWDAVNDRLRRASA